MTKNDAENIVYELAKGKKMGGEPYSFGHIKNAALLAENIANACGLDTEKAYVLGLLHDVGRFFVIDENNELIFSDKHRHPIEGYLYLKKLGYVEEARVCITHAFIYQKNSYAHMYTEIEKEIISQVLSRDYDMYDLLIQLTDEMSVLEGWCTLETRLAREALQHGYERAAWEKFIRLYEIKKLFDKHAKKDIYGFIMDNILFA